MKVREVKRILLIFIIILSLLSFFLLAVLIVFISLVVLDKELDETRNRNVEEGRYYRFDLSKNETSATAVGFSRYSTEEQIIYDDEGIVHYFQEIGSEDDDVEFYECSGTCYCDEVFELIDRRSGSRRGGNHFVNGAIFGVATFYAVKSIGLIRNNLEKRFEEKCSKIMDGVCADAFFHSKLGDCSVLESFEEHRKKKKEDEVKKVERVICKGSCLPTPLLDDSKKECQKMSLTTLFNRETLSSLEDTKFFADYKACYERHISNLLGEVLFEKLKEKEPELYKDATEFHAIIVPNGCFESLTLGIYGFFAEHFLKDFCLESEADERVLTTPDLRKRLEGKPMCQAWIDQVDYLGEDNGSIQWWTRREWKKKNKSIDCVIKADYLE